ncbi:PadR family transcriptional regulator [Clostridioides difficile]|nr:PadR family transcriptional regulator [Clostridioides difficile]MCI9976052.1 PadR family transcriptional regulator [Clostridioides difficile]MDB3086386.1 PadR family transcriptional regulator [Clostridioides difficile]NJI80928.1 PadR family transcriptional regulator [Clostridioides difficile]
MGTLKYAILGLLNRKPMTGYDLSKEFNFQLNEFWSAKHSQIYPELKKLTNEDLIVHEVEISGDVLEKKVYYITEKGKDEFLTWLSKDIPMEPTPKNKFRLRVYFYNNLDLENRIDLLKHQLIQHSKRLEFLMSQKDAYAEIPDFYDDYFGDYLVLDGAIIREEGQIKWLSNCIDICLQQGKK